MSLGGGSPKPRRKSAAAEVASAWPSASLNPDHDAGPDNEMPGDAILVKSRRLYVAVATKRKLSMTFTVAWVGLSGWSSGGGVRGRRG